VLKGRNHTNNRNELHLKRKADSPIVKLIIASMMLQFAVAKPSFELFNRGSAKKGGVFIS
jgi:hypothetical protein